MRAIFSVALLAALAACASPYYSYPPAGIPYACAGQPARIVYNDHGFLPGLTYREPYVGNEARPRPRSTARLTYNGRDYQMVADWAVFEGIRYRSAEPYSETHDLVWEAQGESAAIGELPVREGGEMRELARCTRIRSVQAAAADARRGDAPHGEAKGGEPHRR